MDWKTPSPDPPCYSGSAGRRLGQRQRRCSSLFPTCCSSWVYPAGPLQCRKFNQDTMCGATCLCRSGLSPRKDVSVDSKTAADTNDETKHTKNNDTGVSMGVEN